MQAHQLAPSEPLLQGLLDQDAEPVRRIIEAAERCLERSGYGGMSVRDIAQEAGVSKSLLHYHFLSKEHVFLELQIAVYNRLAARVTTALARIEPGTERSLMALDALLEVLRNQADLPLHTEIWSRSLTNPKLRSHARRLREYLRVVAIDTIEKLLGPALDRLPFGADVAADVVLAAISGLSLQAAFDDGEDRVEAAFRGLRSIIGLALRTNTEERAEPAREAT